MIETMSKEEMQSYQGVREVPDDFYQYWQQLILSLQLPELKVVEKDFHIKQIRFFDLYFNGTNGSQVYAKMLLPNTNQKTPVIFHFHGYQGCSSDWSEYFKFVMCGYGVIALDVRGQAGKSQDNGQFDGLTVKGHIVRGMIAGRERLFYQDIFLDVYTLIEQVRKLPEIDDENMQTFGASQGGALAVVGAALHPRIKQVVTIYPFLADFPRILELGQITEPYDELFRYFKFQDPFYRTKEQIFKALDYIDIKNFAHMIKGKVKLLTGIRDDICPPSTQYAFFNRVQTNKEHILLPEYGHEALNVGVNDLCFNWLINTEIEGV
ncbi:acetylxylan esterase [Enterococcus sp. 5B3_DIV0040]|uniref:acetylxylan esterase n=1 Tax=Enterococcus sp. 5B3_DIV0040 TaxID=1834182 RepID=UPI000A33782A|nr:acetylxylan esterase [Enterococcus sp. 5B3_DIV0040]OTO01287.1 hypothetical protein A5883_003604 [Enterococcus sp. 5B3_DIV0040]